MRERVAGLLVLLLICTSIAHGVDARFPRMIAGGLAWAAALMLWHRVRGVQRLQTLAMLVLGSAGLVWVYWRHEALPWRQVLIANEALIAMVSAVTFLRLIAQPSSGPDEALPRGRGAMRQTLFGVHLFGSVINYSAVPIFGDRIARGGQLARAQTIMLSRGFSSAAHWSPFFAAMGVALLNAPGASLFTVMALGLPVAMIALLSTTAVLAHEPDIDRFRGYPMHFGALKLPGALAAATVSNPNLLAMLFLMTWALGVAISPVSVMNLGFQGRYGINSFRFIGLNGRYVLVMLAVDVVALYLSEWLLNW